MCRNKCLALILFCATSLSGYGVAGMSETGTSETGTSEIRLVTGEWAPYIQASAENQGFLSELVIRAFEHAGVKARVEYRPWKRVAREIDQHDRVSYGWSQDAARLKKWHFSEPLISAQDVFVLRKDSGIAWRDYMDLKPYTIGTVLGYGLPDEIFAIRNQLRIRAAARDELNLRMLLEKRIDLAIINRNVAEYLLHQDFTPTERAALLVTAQPLATYSLHLVCSKTSESCKESIRVFNEGLAKLIHDGRRQQVMDAVVEQEPVIDRGAPAP